MTTVGIFNRYWTTVGGAETYGAAMAQVLARSHTVELLGPDPIDLDELAARLRLDLTGIGFRRVSNRDRTVTAASEDYDLFVNVSYLSSAPTAGEGSIYVVHFPDQPNADLNWAQRLAIWGVGPLVRPHAVDTDWGDGFYPREGGRPRFFWTNGDARCMVAARPDADLDVRLVFARQRPPDMDPITVEVQVAGQPVAELTVTGGGSAIERRRGLPVIVTVPADTDGREVEIRIVSDTFVPADRFDTDDDRHLGVALTSLHTGTSLRERVGALLGAWFPLLYRSPGDVGWLATYEHVVCNSAFTRGWVERWWDREGVVLYPPVQMHGSGVKEPIILSVGRFFGSGMGHSKKQLELVEAFRLLSDRGVEGWTLHLLGGCGESDRGYLESVRAAAEGLPVVFHIDAPGDELENLYARASVFWHATGLGEDAEATPHRLEHFGIATVEAMSAGVVPVVFAAAGQLEIVEDGVNGRYFATGDELVDKTLALIGDEAYLTALSKAAVTRAEDFSLDRFGERLEVLLDS